MTMAVDLLSPPILNKIDWKLQEIKDVIPCSSSSTCKPTMWLLQWRITWHKNTTQSITNLHLVKGGNGNWWNGQTWPPPGQIHPRERIGGWPVRQRDFFWTRSLCFLTPLCSLEWWYLMILGPQIFCSFSGPPSESLSLPLWPMQQMQCLMLWMSFWPRWQRHITVLQQCFHTASAIMACFDTAQIDWESGGPSSRCWWLVHLLSAGKTVFPRQGCLHCSTHRM